MTQDPANNATLGHDVFVSYASQDAAVANSLVENLESQGLKCWLVLPRNVRAGAVYADAIVRAINEAKAVLLVMSGSAATSAHVGREVERAASKRKQIIAFRIDTVALNPELEYFQVELTMDRRPKAQECRRRWQSSEAAVGQGSAPLVQQVPGGRALLIHERRRGLP